MVLQNSLAFLSSCHSAASFLPQCPTLSRTGTSIFVAMLGMPDQGDDYAENNQILNFFGRRGIGWDWIRSYFPLADGHQNIA